MMPKVLSIPLTWDFYLNLGFQTSGLAIGSGSFNSPYLGFLLESKNGGKESGSRKSSFNSPYLGFLLESSRL